MEEEESSLGKALLCLERQGQCFSLIAHNFLCIHYAHSQAWYYFDAIILRMALFLFFRTQERDKKNFIMSLSGKLFSSQRKRVVESTSAELFTAHSFPRARKPVFRVGLAVSLSSRSIMGSNFRFDSWVCVGPQLLGDSIFMMKGKHTVD